MTQRKVMRLQRQKSQQAVRTEPEAPNQTVAEAVEQYLAEKKR